MENRHHHVLCVTSHPQGQHLLLRPLEKKIPVELNLTIKILEKKKEMAGGVRKTPGGNPDGHGLDTEEARRASGAETVTLRTRSSRLKR